MKAEFDSELTLDLALVMAQLRVLERSQDVLYELADIKELRALQDQLRGMLADLSSRGLVPEDPLDFTRKTVIGWFYEAAEFAAAGKGWLDETLVYTGGESTQGYHSLKEFQKLLGGLEDYLANFRASLTRLIGSCPKGFFATEQLQDRICALLGQLTFLELEKAPTGNMIWVLQLVLNGSGRSNSQADEMEAELKQQKETFAEHTSAAEAQKQSVTKALVGIASGDYSEAENVLRVPEQKRHEDTLIEELATAVKERDVLLKAIDEAQSPADRLDLIDRAISKLKADRWPNSSWLKQQLWADREQTAKAKKLRTKRNTFIGAAAAFILALAIGFGFYQLNEQVKEQARLLGIARLEAERKAEQARLEAERKAEVLRAWASSPEGKDMELDLAGVPLEMKWVAPGSFLMGSPSSEDGRFSDEGPQTRVTISKGFWLGRHEVTQAQWQALMGSNPSSFKDPSLPVEKVSWNDAMAFCKKLTERERAAGRLPEGYAYTLPTEARWEYACRAGTTTALNNGTNLTSTYGACRNLDALGWYHENSGGTTHPVGQKQPNGWGLYDMHGNVWEWCADWYAGKLPGGSVTDPAGASSGAYRVFRGGSFGCIAQDCRSAYRYGIYPGNRGSSIGFRPALSQLP
jgi:formylglycine-generating enzyme required for sulfatase activity